MSKRPLEQLADAERSTFETSCKNSRALRDSELMAANARAEYWKRQANGEIPPRDGEQKSETQATERYLLRLLHGWFLKKAPEHYKGCGLYIDVIAALSSIETE